MLKRWKNNNKGFTLVEVIVTTTIATILVGAMAFGIVAYTRYSSFKKQNEFAKELFTAAQMQMTTYSIRDDIDGLIENVSANVLPVGSITNSSGNAVSMDDIWHDEDVNYQGELYYLCATKGDYERYCRGELTASEGALKSLYDIFDSYLYDKTVLDGAICVEFAPKEGMVYSVLYSDEWESFTYGEPGGGDGQTDDCVNICNRTEEYRRENTIGFFGVDELTKVEAGTIETPELDEVILNNGETLELSFALSSFAEATGVLTYQADILDASNSEQLLSIEFNNAALKTSNLDMANYQLVAESATLTPHTIEAQVTDIAQAGLKSGRYTFPAWVDSSDRIHIVLDAVDLGTADGDVEASLMSESFSMHRLGISADEIYCAVHGFGGGYRTTPTRESNYAHTYFDDIGVTELNGSNVTECRIANMRHLYNMRFCEARTDNTPIAYTITDDLSWDQMIEHGAVYKSKADVVDGVGRHWITEDNSNDMYFSDSMLRVEEDAPSADKAFPSVSKLKSSSTIRSTSAVNPFAIKDIGIYKSTNNRLGVNTDLPDGEGGATVDATGLFLVNYGTVTSIAMDNIDVHGENAVGSICGINAGVVEHIEVRNSSRDSKVFGNRDVGGIVGASFDESGTFEYESLLNRAKVTGFRYVGGITGRAESSDSISITINNCRNYGQLSGREDSFGIKTAEYIGGIAGLTKRYDAGVISLTHCVSSPQYLEEEILDESGIIVERTGQFVGGIVGMNDGGALIDCNTECEKDKTGYVIGDKYVGGIVGYNSGVAGSLDGDENVNQANVIGNTYVGGIVGVNASLDQSTEPVKTYSDENMVMKWSNEGIIVAENGYVGGIAGFNAGIVEKCGSDVEFDASARNLLSVNGLDGDYAGGIAGYNNGIIRSPEEAVSVVAIINGNNYVGGIVGYNDDGADCDVSGYSLEGGYVEGDMFVGGFIGLNTNEAYLARVNQIEANPNSVKGNYCVGGVIGGNIVAQTDNYEITCKAENAFGSIEAKQFVGGVFGYVLMTDSAARNLVAINEISQGITDNYINNYSLLKAQSFTSDKVLTVSNASTQFNRIAGDVFVGGIFGFNGENTNLHIVRATNKTPIFGLSSIEVDEIGDGSGKHFSYVGGIISMVSKNVIVERCENSGVGDVSGKGDFVGGVSEVNKGLIYDCTVKNIGNKNENNIGGIAGLNCPQSATGTFGSGGYVASVFGGKDCLSNTNRVYHGVYNCKITGIVSGHDNIGGFVSSNAGMIYRPKAVATTIRGFGTNIGGIAGQNLPDGRIELHEQLGISITGSARNVGGVVGRNLGIVRNDDELTNAIFAQPDVLQTLASYATISSGNTIVGEVRVGGIIGLQLSGDVSGFTNNATITANDGAAAGIIGATDENHSVSDDVRVEYCLNKGKVRTTLSGAAGGIISYVSDRCVVENCQNAGGISSANGESGGVAGINDGEIITSIVGTCTGDTGKVNISGDLDVGAIASKNNAVISDCRLSNVEVSNNEKIGERTGSGGTVGGFVGINNGTIEIGENSVLQLQVTAKKNKCSAGGIAGVNDGDIVSVSENNIIFGNSEDPVSVACSSQKVTVANLGGLVGENRGEILNCEVYASVNGTQGDSTSPEMGYGGIAGVNNGEISTCSFDGVVFAAGNGNLISCIGGIAGINTTSGSIEECIVGRVENGHTVIQCGTSNEAYGYVGGMSGVNSGIIKNCDNKEGSKAEVYILNYAGQTGGVTGQIHAGATVTGTSETKIMSTGDKWFVYACRYDNDCGTGGIAGYSASGENLVYVHNYARVCFIEQAENSSTGGFIGRLENAESSVLTFSNCENYGNIYSLTALQGGFIGTLKYNGLTFNNCKNFGDVGSKSPMQLTYYDKDDTQGSISFYRNASASAGFIGRTYMISAPIVEGNNASDGYNTVAFKSCENHGAIYSSSSAAGFVALATTGPYADFVITNSINTGCVTSGNFSAGFISSCDAARGVYYNQCRNYGLTGTANKSNHSGFHEGSRRPNAINDCLDCSNSTKYPISTGTNSAYFTDNCYVSDNTTVVQGTGEEELTDTILKGEVLKTPVDASSLIQAAYPLTRCYDGSERMNSAANKDNTGRLTLPSNDYTIPPQITFNMLSPTALTSFDITWGSTGANNVFRKYLYKLYYSLEGSDDWIEVKSDAENEHGNVEYDMENQYYECVGYDNNYDSSYSRYSHAINLAAGEKIQSIIIRVMDTQTASAPQGPYSPTRFIVIREVCPLNNGALATISSANCTQNSFEVDPSDTTLSRTYNNNTSDVLKCTSKDASPSVYANSPNSKGEICYTLKQPLRLASFGIRWMTPSATDIRRYAYRLYYKVEGSPDWVEVTSSRTDGQYQMSYNTAIGCYCVEAKYSNVSESTFYHNFDQLGENEKVEKVKIEMVSASNKTTGSYKLNTGTYISEVMTMGVINKDIISDNNGYGVTIGAPLAVGGTSGAYTLTSSTNMQLTGITENPANGYKQDFSNWKDKETSPRLKLYEAIEKAYIEYINGKYDGFDGTITVNKPIDIGNRTYRIDWSSTGEAFDYELTYQITEADGTILKAFDEGDDKVVTVKKQGEIKIPSRWEGKYVSFGVRAGYYEENENGDYLRAYSARATTAQVQVKESLPTPQIHLEMIKVEDDYKYRIVLDNSDKYDTFAGGNVNINVIIANDSYSFIASEHESAATIPVNLLGGIMVKSFANDPLNVYGDSATKTVQTMLMTADALHSTDYVGTRFNNFKGGKTSDLTYSVLMQKKLELETYYMVELLAYDERLQTYASVSTGEIHVSDYGSALTAVLGDMPENLVSDLVRDPTKSIQVRTYPWRTQAYMCYYGRTIASGISDADVLAMDIFNPDHSLKAGYVIHTNIDNSYDVIFSSILENEDYFSPQIDSKRYTAEQSGASFNLVSLTGGYSVPIEPLPVIESNFTKVDNNGGFRFEWDEDKNYTSPEYNVTFTAIESDGTEYEISSETTEDNFAFFSDQERTYPNLRMTVERLGEENASTGDTERFAVVSESIFNIKIPLLQITNPIIALYTNESGVIERDELMYDVSWPENDNAELSCYEITCEHTNDNGKVTKIVWRTTDTVGTVTFDGSTTADTPAITYLTPKSASAVISLSCLQQYAGDSISISVRPIAASYASTYSDGVMGVAKTATLPERLKTPLLENMTYNAAEAMSEIDFVNTGVVLSMSQTYTQKGSYEMFIEITDALGTHIDDVMQNGEVVTKANPIRMNGGLGGAQFRLSGIPITHAGRYIKIVMRAVGDSNTSSKWTDADDSVTSSRLFALPNIE